jgi:hypothetical protein
MPWNPLVVIAASRFSETMGGMLLSQAIRTGSIGLGHSWSPGVSRIHETSN